MVSSTPPALRALLDYVEQPNFPPRYNVAPTQPIAIVQLVDAVRHFALVRWRLLPSWVKDPKKFPLLINARGESVCEKAAFSAAMRRRRCLVPADGFYEWQSAGGRKIRPLETYEISTAVNRTANDNPKLVQRITIGAERQRPAAPHVRKKRDDGQDTLF